MADRAELIERDARIKRIIENFDDQSRRYQTVVVINHDYHEMVRPALLRSLEAKEGER